MKLNFKDLRQQSFTIDAEPSETIAELKQKVAAEKSADVSQIKLIYSGKILADANTIESYNIEQKGHIVCMVQKPKAAPAASSSKAAPSTPAPAAAPETPAAPAAAPQPATTTNAPATPSPAPAQPTTTTESPRGAGDPSMMVGPERQAAMANLESMGFERPQIERAMRAAFYNPDRAVEYLLNGIPENLQQQAEPPQRAQPPPAAQAPTAGAVPAPAETPASPPPAAPTAAAEVDEPVNLFEAAAAAAGGGSRSGSRAGGATGAATGAPAAGAGGGASADLGAGAAAAAAAGGNLDFLRDNQTFQHLRQLVQQNPQMLESVLQQVGASNPQLAAMIQANPDQFLQLLSEGQEGEGVPLPPGAQTITVTEEERDAIERLCRLGFERDLVIRAYFACDKNEELAANFLFEYPDDEQEGQ